MQVSLVDLKAQYQSIRQEILKELEAVWQNTSFLLGPSVKTFEGNFTKFIRTRHVIGFTSETTANQLAVQALIKPGEEIIATPNTSILTDEAITVARGEVIFIIFKSIFKLEDFSVLTG